jgi:hypothetical protein
VLDVHNDPSGLEDITNNRYVNISLEGELDLSEFINLERLSL